MQKIKSKKNTNSKFSKNQTLVLKLLEKMKKPLTAYTILDKLRNDGFRAPLQVYRALDSLIKVGKVHRIESMNAFVACNNNCEKLDFTAFAICDECEDVSEIKDDSISSSLSILKQKSGLKTTRSNIELHGLCKKCK
tara:strand:- start:400 stop:810 length:411 start_codon:yes stop_codon:yes gene_type:complete